MMSTSSPTAIGSRVPSASQVCSISVRYPRGLTRNAVHTSVLTSSGCDAHIASASIWVGPLPPPGIKAAAPAPRKPMITKTAITMTNGRDEKTRTDQPYAMRHFTRGLFLIQASRSCGNQAGRVNPPNTDGRPLACYAPIPTVFPKDPP